MRVIGITGPTGAGKTTVLQALESLGGVLIDADAVYHDLTRSSQAMQAELIARFGPVYDGNELDRKKLGAVVFQDENALADLNRITHKYIARETQRRIEAAKAAGATAVGIDAIGLLESQLVDFCDCTLAVTAPEELRVKRIMARDGISEDYARLRVSAQKPSAWFQAHCDYTIESTEADTVETTGARAKALFEEILEGNKTMEENKKTPAQQKRDALFFSPTNGYDRLADGEEQAIQDYCAGYKTFLDEGKIERECVTYTIAQAEAAGFRPLVRGEKLQAGDKVYYNNRGKSVMLAVIGQESLAQGVVIGAAHIDSPRLDLKQNPLYEDKEMAYCKTHYYGGIKKYQWTTIPLALHGLVVLKDGTSVSVRIGEDPGDPQFTVGDLLPHLAGDQAKKTMGAIVTAEQLNLFVGSRPFDKEAGADRVKLAVMAILNEKYGMVEEDFLSAELMAVPAAKAVDIGLDRSVIGAYGQDDRVCAYACLKALLDLTETPRRTAICVLADKEEIGSLGVTGMQSAAFDTFMSDLCEGQGVQRKTCYEHSFCLSADVTAAYDPNFAEAYEPRNSAYINYGVCISKYTGARGKSGASDASAELVGYVRRTFAEAGVIWQLAELGKTDQGGGGTVACYMANRNIDTIDAGPCTPPLRPRPSWTATWPTRGCWRCISTERPNELRKRSILHEHPILDFPGAGPGCGGVSAHLQLRPPVPVPALLWHGVCRRQPVFRRAAAPGHPHCHFRLLPEGHPGPAERAGPPHPVHLLIPEAQGDEAPAPRRADDPDDHHRHPAPVCHPAHQEQGGGAVWQHHFHRRGPAADGLPALLVRPDGQGQEDGQVRYYAGRAPGGRGAGHCGGPRPVPVRHHHFRRPRAGL